MRMRIGVIMDTWSEKVNKAIKEIELMELEEELSWKNEITEIYRG